MMTPPLELKRIVEVVGIITIVAAANVANAQDVVFNWLGSTTGQKSALSGTCNFTKPDAMECNLRQITFRYKLGKDEAKKQIDNIPVEIEKELKSVTVKDWIENGVMACKDLTSFKDKVSDTEVYDRLTELCKNPTKENLIPFLQYMITTQTQTCLFSEIDLGNFKFQNVNKSRWVSNNGPTGACGAVVVMTLDSDPKHQILWKYSQTKQYLNLESKMCKSLLEVNEPMGYSWQAPKPMKADCKFVEYGI